MDTPNCGLGGVDQREFLNPATSTCDAGAVQTGGNGAPSLSVGDVDLGSSVAVGTPTAGAASLSNVGGDLVGVSGVSISGAGWTITSDGCTYAVLEASFFAPLGGCSVAVSLTATHRGIWNGTLTIHTTAGDRTAHLHAQTPAAPPSISSFTPMSGPVGTTVIITGSHFTGTSAVSVGGTAAASFTVMSDTQIDAVVAPGTATGVISVTSPNGIATTIHPFVVVVSHPVISSFSPGSGLVGTTVTILGQFLSGASAVNFNGVPAVTFTASSGSVIVTVPAGATTGHIAITTPGGTATTVRIFTVIPAAPTITSFTPTSALHGVYVNIHGSRFTGATSVKFHGVEARFTVVSDTLIIAVVPLGATTGHISVTTAGGTAVSLGIFSI
jgi:hypothetical protein